MLDEEESEAEVGQSDSDDAAPAQAPAIERGGVLRIRMLPPVPFGCSCVTQPWRRQNHTQGIKVVDVGQWGAGGLLGKELPFQVRPAMAGEEEGASAASFP